MAKKKKTKQCKEVLKTIDRRIEMKELKISVLEKNHEKIKARRMKESLEFLKKRKQETIDNPKCYKK